MTPRDGLRRSGQPVAERGMLRWTVHLEGGPRRVNHAAVAVGHKVYSFGGYCSGEDYETLRQIDVHVFNTGQSDKPNSSGKPALSLRWTKLPPVRTGGREHAREVPYMRYGHTAVLVDETIYIWGGRNDTEGACNVLYAFDVNHHRWFTPKISGTVPGARDGHSACVLGKAMYIFGGYEQLADCFSNEIHKLDTSSMCWSLVSARGTPARWRDFHSATIIGTKMFVFGGRADRFGPFHSNNEIYCNKIKIFDTETNCWLNTPTAQLLPEGRRSHSAFSYNGELYIFGGYNARLDRHFNDLWKFNPEVLFTRTARAERPLRATFIGVLLEEGGAEGQGSVSQTATVLLYGGRSHHPLRRNQELSAFIQQTVLRPGSQTQTPGVPERILNELYIEEAADSLSSPDSGSP
ncbi:Kelch domain-containing protein 3 [Labeo rohita]|uniref:Kelch domain-containing protein 3 n=1 Tax=Labeo rohita TaxID=84645 RepID=A0ABQ8M5K4_LABRO|nr:Kelch domain-containing protein 3 [Labeo rohita]